jgi:hypothetical protein
VKPSFVRGRDVGSAKVSAQEQCGRWAYVVEEPGKLYVSHHRYESPETALRAGYHDAETVLPDVDREAA